MYLAVSNAFTNLLTIQMISKENKLLQINDQLIVLDLTHVTSIHTAT